MDLIDSLNTALADRYELEREIGRGGMATVYLARDIRHERNVALKVLSPELGAVLGAERFLAEIRVTANLQHPNLLPLFDSGEANPTSPMALSPNGQAVVFTAGPNAALFLRRLDQLEPTAVAKIEHPTNMRFSADGNWLVYQSAGLARRLSEGYPLMKVAC